MIVLNRRCLCCQELQNLQLRAILMSVPGQIILQLLALLWASSLLYGWAVPVGPWRSPRSEIGTPNHQFVTHSVIAETSFGFCRTRLIQRSLHLTSLETIQLDFSIS